MVLKTCALAPGAPQSGVELLVVDDPPHALRRVSEKAAKMPKSLDMT